jgi:hypothetical protein
MAAGPPISRCPRTSGAPHPYLVVATTLPGIPLLTVIEMPYPCGCAEMGKPPSMALVSDAGSCVEWGPLSHALRNRGRSISAIVRQMAMTRRVRKSPADHTGLDCPCRR